MKKILFGIVMALLLAIPAVGFAENNTSTANTPLSSEAISQNCRAAQSYVDTKLKDRDIRARVDRLQAYNYIYQRLDTLTLRLEKNNQPGAKEMRSQMEKLHAAIGSFRAAYEVYDVARDQLVQIDKCKDKPTEFYAELEEVRAKRQLVTDSIVTVQQILQPKLEEQLTNLKQIFSTKKKD